MNTFSFFSLMTRFVALAATFGLALSSCVSIFDLEDYAGAVHALCSEFNNCFQSKYPSCSSRGSARLTSAAPDVRSQWLGDFVDKKCFGICNDTWTCLDSQPICGAVGSGCQIDEECCAFSDAASTCDGGRCCMQDGQACQSDDSCCSGRCIDDTCGGVVCARVEENCERDEDCCDDLRCDATSETCFKCREAGFECDTDEQCCGSCVEGICQECRLDGDPCGDASECCNPFCVLAPTPDGDAAVCSSGDCWPDGSSCGGDPTLCCSKNCDRVTDKCAPCALDGQSCVDDGDCCANVCAAGICGADCLPAAQLCALDGQCCSHLCSPWALQNPQSGQAPSCCLVPPDHLRCANVCVPRDGLPMGNDCPLTNLTTDPTIADDCIEQVCLADPYCCCTEWDSQCVSEMQQICGVSCAETTN